MKLYRKKLNSVEELKRECLRLKYEQRRGDAKDFLPKIESASPQNKGGGLLGIALELLDAQTPMQAALSVASPLMGMINGKRKKAKAAKPDEPSVVRKIAGKVIKDIVVTYLTGKAVQLTAKGIRSFLKQKKKKKMAARAMSGTR